MLVYPAPHDQQEAVAQHLVVALVEVGLDNHLAALPSRVPRLPDPPSRMRIVSLASILYLYEGKVDAVADDGTVHSNR